MIDTPDYVFRLISTNRLPTAFSLAVLSRWLLMRESISFVFHVEELGIRLKLAHTPFARKRVRNQ